MLTKSVILVTVLAFHLPVIKSDCSEVDEALATLTEALANLTEEIISCTNSCKPEYASCSEVLEANPDAQSGEYTLTIDGNEITVYCEMGDGICGGEQGWMRIAYYNITAGDDCPSGLSTYTRENKKLCDRSQESSGCRCDGTFFDTQGISYNKVCGRVRGYQHNNRGLVDGLFPNNKGQNFLDGCYVDGVSVTRGDPREHVWTFGDGDLESRSGWTDCPCNTGSSTPSPSYIGENYYCESAASSIARYTFYLGDPLWDGQDCNARETPCCANSNLPYFVRTLNTASADPIELRMCSSEGLPDESIPVDLIEIYVKIDE